MKDLVTSTDKDFEQQEYGNFCSENNKFDKTDGAIFENGDTLCPVELILWQDQGNQGDRREQDDQGEDGPSEKKVSHWPWALPPALPPRV